MFAFIFGTVGISDKPSVKVLKGENRKFFEIERIKLDVKIAELKNYRR